jgi:hypothetical protein
MLSKNHLSPFLLLILTGLNNPSGCEKGRDVALLSIFKHSLMISFGAIVGGMIATSRDEAFVMLVQFPGTALVLFGLLFVSGIIFAWISDKAVKILAITPCDSCVDAQCEHCESGMDNHEPIGNIFRPVNLLENFRSFPFTRVLLLMLIVSFMLLVFTGILGPSTWDWKRFTFMVLSLGSLYILYHFMECIRAIEFLHKNGEKHGDIRRDHIFIDREENRYRRLPFS